MIFDHIALTASDYEKSRRFFVNALQPLGIELAMEFEGSAGFGKDGKPELWLSGGKDAQRPMHIAFVAATRAQVAAFYAAAIAAGGKDNGPPGVRANYHPNYFGAFVIGPDGHNVEAVCHKPEA
jgi:catechol 2,3-dioxygenase-like lactoylglutathione lyase family enzyme